LAFLNVPVATTGIYRNSSPPTPIYRLSYRVFIQGMYALGIKKPHVLYVS